MEETQAPQSANFAQKKERNTSKKAGVILLVLVLMISAAAAGWWYRDQEADKVISAKNQEIATANQRAEDLTKELEETRTASSDTTSLPSQEIRNNIQAAIRSKNYAAMQDYLAERISVIIAASEGLGSRTPAQAIEDMKYLDDATDPWNFTLKEETLTAYSEGNYGMYIPEGSLTGESDDSKFVSISFNGAGKIVGIFMSAHTDLLTQ